MKLYIVIGERENVYQDEIGGPFLPHPSKEIVSVFSTLEKAEKFITSNKLKKQKKERFGDTENYKTGHESMEIEEHFLNE